MASKVKPVLLGLGGALLGVALWHLWVDHQVLHAMQMWHIQREQPRVQQPVEGQAPRSPVPTTPQ